MAERRPKRVRSEDYKLKKKIYEQSRGKTRVNIGEEAFQRWRDLRELKAMTTDAEVALFLLDSCNTGSSISTTSPGSCTPEPTSPSSSGHEPASKSDEQHQQEDVEHQIETTHLAGEVDWLPNSIEVTIEEDTVENEISDSDNDDLKNIPEKTERTELRAAGADDLCSEDPYVPLLPNKSFTTTALLLECEEEELQPSQQPTSIVHIKDEKDDGEMKEEQIDCPLNPSSPQRTENTELQRPSEGLNASSQLTSDTESIGSFWKLS